MISLFYSTPSPSTFTRLFLLCNENGNSFLLVLCWRKKTVSAAQKKCSTEAGNGLKWNLNSTPSVTPFSLIVLSRKSIIQRDLLSRSFVWLFFVRSSIATHKSYDIFAWKRFSTREFSSFFSSFPIHVHTNTFLDSLLHIWNKTSISIMLCIHDGFLFILFVLE